MSSNFPFLKNEGDWSLNSLHLEPSPRTFPLLVCDYNAFGWVPFWSSPTGVSCNSQPHSFFSPQTTEYISETFFWLYHFPSFWSEVEQIHYWFLERRFGDHTNKRLQELRHSGWVLQESEFDRQMRPREVVTCLGLVGSSSQLWSWLQLSSSITASDSALFLLTYFQ